MNTEGWALVQQGRFLEAVEIFTQALTHPERGTTVGLHYNRGTAFLGLHDYASAATDFGVVTRLSPGTEDGHLWLGACRWCVSQPVEAVQAWRSGLNARWFGPGGDVHIPPLLYYAGVRLHDAPLLAESKQLLRIRARRKRIATSYPGGIIPYLLGKITTQELVVAAFAPYPPYALHLENRRCQLGCFRGVRAFADGDTTAYQDAMRDAAAYTNCYQEPAYHLANWEVQHGFPTLASFDEA